jgi:hypothetical protein
MSNALAECRIYYRRECPTRDGQPSERLGHIPDMEHVIDNVRVLMS